MSKLVHIAHRYGPHCGIADGCYTLISHGNLHPFGYIVLIFCVMDVLMYREQ